MCISVMGKGKMKMWVPSYPTKGCGVCTECVHKQDTKTDMAVTGPRKSPKGEQKCQLTRNATILTQLVV